MKLKIASNAKEQDMTYAQTPYKVGAHSYAPLGMVIQQ